MQIKKTQTYFFLILLTSLLQTACATISVGVSDPEEIKPGYGIIFGSIDIKDDQGKTFNKTCYLLDNNGEKFKPSEKAIFLKSIPVTGSQVFSVMLPKTTSPQRLRFTCGDLFQITTIIDTAISYEVIENQITYVGKLNMKLDMRNHSLITDIILENLFGELLNVNGKRSAISFVTDDFANDVKHLKPKMRSHNDYPITKKLYQTAAQDKLTQID